MSEELTQETFYQAIRSLDRFDGSCKISTWLCAIARNQLMSYRRKHPAEQELDAAKQVTSSTETDVIDTLSHIELLKKLHTCPEPFRLPCEIVRDLLPSYVDGLTSEVTNDAIHEHIETCDDCKATLKRMQEPEEIESEEEQEKEIDFLKKTRIRARRMIAMSMATMAFLVVAVFLVRMYFVGDEMYADSVLCQTTVSENKVSVSGTVVDSARGISEIEFEEKDGIVTISMKATLVSPFHKGDFEATYEADEAITQVKIGNRILWDHGEKISAETSAVYNAKHLYIGDMSANGALANALGMRETLGRFENELHTTSEPYGWSIYLQEEIDPANEKNIQTQMASYAYVLLATIDNLDYIQFHYAKENDNICINFSREDASDFLGKDVKTCANTAADLQDFMKQVEPGNISERED